MCHKSGLNGKRNRNRNNCSLLGSFLSFMSLLLSAGPPICVSNSPLPAVFFLMFFLLLAPQTRSEVPIYRSTALADYLYFRVEWFWSVFCTVLNLTCVRLSIKTRPIQFNEAKHESLSSLYVQLATVTSVCPLSLTHFPTYLVHL